MYLPGYICYWRQLKGNRMQWLLNFLLHVLGDAGATRVQVKLVRSIPEMCTYILYIRISIGIMISHAVLAT